MYFSQQQQQIYKQLRNWITGASYIVGDGLPKEVELAKRFKIARNTLRPCLDQLVKEGLVVRIKGKGTFVSEAALKFQKYKNIGLIMPALSVDLTFSQSPTHYFVFDGIQKFCHENSWDIQVISRKGEEFSFENVSRLDIVGLIIVFPRRPTYDLISKLKEHDIPFLCINLHSEKVNRGLSFVNVDFYSAACDAVNDLISAGRKNIGLVSTYEMADDLHPFHVMKAFRHTIKDAGMTENIITPKDVDIRLPADKIKDFFKANIAKIKRCDTVITTNLEEVLALHDILTAEKIKVPEDIALVTFFENEKTREKGIISYSPDFQLIGYKSASLLSDILDDEKHEIKQIKIKPQLAVDVNDRSYHGEN